MGDFLPLQEVPTEPLSGEVDTAGTSQTESPANSIQSVDESTENKTGTAVEPSTQSELSGQGPATLDAGQQTVDQICAGVSVTEAPSAYMADAAPETMEESHSQTEYEVKPEPLDFNESKLAHKGSASSEESSGDPGKLDSDKAPTVDECPPSAEPPIDDTPSSPSGSRSSRGPSDISSPGEDRSPGGTTTPTSDPFDPEENSAQNDFPVHQGRAESSAGPFNIGDSPRPLPEPIAICGIALRLPGGVRTPEAFWDVLYNGKDLRGPIPADRFNIDGFDDSLGSKSAVKTRYGYFLDEDLGTLDTSFFSMSKQEVEKTDPQQRQMLEVARECLESAGETEYRGKLVGCYVGTFGEDWLQMQSKENQFTGGYNFSGDLMIANRLSYEYDFKGPSMVIKTGCSASLVGLHEACRALQSGDCTSALVGGTSLLMGPTIFQVMTSEGILSPEGSCKTFDAAANGFARAEGINAVYLKPLKDAIRDGNPVRAVIRNTGTNSDGKSQGLLTPSSAAQEALMRKVYEDAKIDPSQTAFIECHGTGTPTGDPLETHAVANLFGEKGIYIGSSKPNAGHSEGASGLTGLIKAVLSIENKTIPPNIKFSQPNPKIRFKEGKMTVPIEPTPWPADRAERVSVNSFGIGGTNAHVIVESLESFRGGVAVPEMPSLISQPQLLVFSANSQDAVRQHAENHLEYLVQHPDRLTEMSYTLSQRREHLQQRMFAIAVEGKTPELLPPVKAPQQRISLAMVFTGQGAQWPQMGRELLDSDLHFRSDIITLDAILSNAKIPPAWNIQEELLRSKEESQVYRAELSQPLCTAVQIGLVNAFRRRGIVPDAVVGHSSGEIAAAYSSGALSMRGAILVSYYRGLVTKQQQLKGGMAAIGLGANAVARFLVDGVVVAAENSPNSTTISGDLEKVDEVVEAVKREKPDVLARKLQVDMAYHSHHMTAIGEQYLDLIKGEINGGGNNRQHPQIPMFSTVTTELVEEPLEPEYWIRNLTSPVKFCPAVTTLLKALPQVAFLEIGPHSQMAGPLRQICAETLVPCTYTPSMIRGKDCAETLLSAFGQLWQQGVGIDFAALTPKGKVLPDLPAYPWDHSAKYWWEGRISKDWRFRPYGHHALLGQRIPESSAFEPSWRVVLDLEDEPWLYGHKVRDDIVFPFAGYVAMAGEAVRQVSGVETGYSVRHVVASTALVLGENKPVEVLTTLRRRKLTDSADSEYWDFAISSYSGSAWIKHCEGSVKPAAQRPAELRAFPRLPRKVSAKKMYSSFARVGLVYGPDFQGITSLEASTTEARAVAQITGAIARPFLFHPGTMDSCFQLFIAAQIKGIGRDFKQLVVPTLIEEIDVFAGAENMTAEAWSVDDGKDVGIDCVANGQLAMCLRGARLTPLEDDNVASNDDKHAAARLAWYPDFDFMDVRSLFDPPQISNQVKQTLEEIVLLCILDSAERVDGLAIGQPHYAVFRDWLFREKQRAIDGIYPAIVEDAAKYVRLSRDERTAAIRERTASIVGDSPLSSLIQGTTRIWENVEDLLTGKQDALEVLLKDNVLAEIYNTVSFGFSRFVKALATSKPTLRILEVGAGTGGTTEMILRGLVGGAGANPPYALYTYTDISAGFFPQATERFAYAPNMEYKVLDVSRSALEQGFDAGSYDLILAPNVIHATPNLQETLGNLRPLLRAGGHLVLTEVCAVARAPGFVFGNFSGWWMGEADGRKWEPYVSVDRWDQELRGAGFTGVDTAVLDGEDPYQLCAAIVSQPAVKKAKLAVSAVTVLCEKPDEGVTQTLISELRGRDIDVSITRFGEVARSDLPILCTFDLEGHFLGDITKERFEAFQMLCREHKGQELLWLMPPTQVKPTDPRWGQTLGVLRAVQAELGIPLYSLEISADKPHYADLVMKVLQKICDSEDVEELRPDREFAIDGGVVKIPRYEPFRLEDEVCIKSQTGSGSVKTLEIGKPGLLETLRWVETSHKTLGADEVEIESKAVGLNFRDIMVAMGVLSFSGSNSRPLGLEVSGIVRRVGENVRHVLPGDRVAAMALDGCFSTHAVVNGVLCVKIPDSLSFDEAATMPSVYTTSLLALFHVGQLERGQSVLIHSACGGIGHAAVELCKIIGAEVYITVGSEQKVKYALEHYGLPRDRIFNSRDDSFVADVMRETGGAGVDLVLNSLSGKLLHASWKCVAEFGKMVELGKRDLVGFGQLDLEPFLLNRSYCCVDLAHMMQKRPSAAGKLLEETIQLYQEDKIQPIRSMTAFEASDVESSFRHLQKGDHIGKAVVRIPDDVSTIPSISSSSPTRFREDASYVLTGGLGGLGKSIALWMVERGARSLVFLSRSAGKNEADQDFFAELESMGCAITAVPGKADVMEDVEKAVRSAPNPIRGVFHLAMVLRDGQFADLPFDDWTAAVSPKVNGAWNLHDALAGADLDFFVATSSIVTCCDQVGQGNYTAANCFLEAFCQHRRALGQPAAVLNICPVEDVGFVAENPAAKKKLRVQGLYFLTESETLDYFELALLNQQPEARQEEVTSPLAPVVAAGNIVMGLRSEVHPSDPKCQTSWRRDRRMGTYHNVRDATASETSSSPSALKTFLARAAEEPEVLSRDDSVEYLALEIGRKIFAFMMKDEADVDLGLTLAQIGMDSLMAIELRRWWKQTFGLEISTLEIMGSGTLRALGKLAAEGVMKKLSD
ncbi:Thiolase-like protein [Pleurostoma richardsiae]|uniref:Thiolase-like protein n=1 Tax=Pleurostoma richardsiae TaxID=41990 RepID=A0AA38VHX5_9PEZI|nr:Thiolase-like protein [Pleurostoma richardsiae]